MPLHKSLIIIPFSAILTLTACGEKPPSSPNSPETTQSVDAKFTESSKDSIKSTTKPKVDRGASLYKRCRTCHTLNKDGAHKAGPNLYQFFGKKAGIKDGFRYSTVMKNSEVIWTDETLAAYLKNPSKFMPGNSMSFAGIRKDEDLKLLIEYLKKNSSGE